MSVSKKKLSPVEKREQARNTRYSKASSKEESDEMNKLQQNLDEQILNYNNNLSDYIAQSEDWLNHPETIAKKKDMMSEMYNRQMIMMCVMPLARGLSIDSVTQSIGAYAGICLINKDFKNSVKRSANAMFGPQIDAFADEMTKKYGPNSLLSKGAGKLKNWRDNMIMQEHGGRMPYTPQSAAVQDLALHKMAFIAMRQPGADIEKIRKQHTEARERLFELAERDGISKDVICQQVRTIIGKQCMYEEKQSGYTEYGETNNGRFNYTSGMFEETAGDGKVGRSDYHEENVLMHDENGKPYMQDKNVWNGEYFVNKNGENFEYEGDFTPRAPRSTEETVDRIKTVFMSAIENSNDGTSFYNNMMSVAYGVGGNTKKGFDYASKGTDDVSVNMRNNVVYAYETFRDAQCDNLDIVELYEGTNKVWRKVCEDTLKNHPNWVSDFKSAWSKDFENNEAKSEQHEQKSETKREYHSDIDGYDFNSEDKSVNNRGKEFEQKHAQILADSDKKQTQLSMG